LDDAISTYEQELPESGDEVEYRHFPNDVRHNAVINGGTGIEFMGGTLLARLSTMRESVPRWTEVYLWRSRNGIFVLHVIGVSLVAHDRSCLNVAGKAHYGVDRIDPHGLTDVRLRARQEAAVKDREPCTICRPDIAMLLKQDVAALTFEPNRHAALWCKDPRELFDAVYADVFENRTVSSIVESCLNLAVEADPLIAEAASRRVKIE